MFLAELKPEQKELFLDLVICLSKSDGCFDESEQKVIIEMCREMGIKKRIDNRFEFKDALIKIKENITEREKRIILLETAGIVLADGNFSEDEAILIKNISEELQIEYDCYSDIIEMVKELYNVYSKIGTFLSGK